MTDFSLGTAELGTSVSLEGLSKGLADAEQETRQHAGGLGGFFGRAFEFAAGGLIAKGIETLTSTVAGAFSGMIGDARGAAQVMAQTQQTIDSMGNAAGVSAQHIAEFASSLSAAAGKSLFDDNQIQAATNMLLTFGNIRGAALDLATAMTVDMAQALKKTPEDMSVMIGKLLNSADAMSAAQRMGVSFTDQQLKLGKQLFDTGHVAEYQNLVLGELRKEFGGQAAAAAQADGGMAQFKDRMGEAAETVGTAVLPLLNDLAAFLNSSVAPAIESAAQTVAAFIPALADFGRDAYAWGVSLISEFANGIAAAASYVVASLGQIGSLITYWLQPGSPPNLLPEIDEWGARTAQAWLDGFGEADLSGVEDLGRTVQDVLKGLVDTGDFDEAGIIPAVLGSEQAMADAIANVDEFGNVAEDALQNVLRAAGPAGPRIEGLVRNFFDLRRATQDVERAQADLNRVTQEYADRLNPLNKELKAIQDQKQQIDDQIRIKDLQTEIADGKTDELTRQKDLLEIQEIQKRAQIRAVEDERDVAVDAAKEKLNAAQEVQKAAQDRMRDEQAAIRSYNQQNQLIGQQISLLQRMQREAEAAEKAKGGGGKGGGPARPEIRPPQISAKPITDPLREIDSAVTDTQNRISAFFSSIQEQAAPAFGVVEDVLRPLADVFNAADDPITGLLDVLSEVSPSFELLRGVVEAALPPIQGIVESVFGIVGGFLEEHGAKIVSDLSTAWATVHDTINAILPPIQQIVGEIFGQIDEFLHANGADIQAFMGQTWDQIAVIVQTALELIQAIVVPIVTFIANFISEHHTEIQAIIRAAWDSIKAIIDAALTLISGVLKATLQAIHGDWEGAWETIKEMCARIVTDILQIVSSNLDALKAEFDLAMDGIRDILHALARDTFGIGTDMVDGIINGVKNAGDRLLDFLRHLAQQALQAAKDAILAHSPSQAFADQVGEPIILGWLQGMLNRVPDLLDAMGTIGEDLLKKAQDIASDIAGALQSGFGAVADLDRQKARNIQDLEDIGAAAYETAAGISRVTAEGHKELVRRQLADAEKAAAAMNDPEQAAKFYKMRSSQIFELAKLQEDLAGAGTEAERARIREQIKLITAAQQAEQNAFKAGQAKQGESGLAKLAKQIQDFLLDPKLPGILEDTSGALQHLFDLLLHLNQTIPPPPPQQGAAMLSLGLGGMANLHGGVAQGTIINNTFHIDARGATMSRAEYEAITRRVVDEAASRADVTQRTRRQ